MKLPWPLSRYIKIKRKKNAKYYVNIVTRAHLVVMPWKDKMDRAVELRDVKRADHILRHIRRIKAVQDGANIMWHKTS